MNKVLVLGDVFVLGNLFKNKICMMFKIEFLIFLMFKVVSEWVMVC